MTSRLLAASLAVVALVALGACDRKEPEPPAPAKAGADDAAKKAARPGPAGSGAGVCAATEP